MFPDNLNRAIAAIKAGDKETGKRLLAGVLTADPRNDTAWVWMSAVAPPGRQRECLERALAANPANEAAKRGLAMLKSTPSPSAVATHRAGEELERFASPPAPVEPPLTTETPLPPIEEPQLAVDTLSSPSAEQPDTPSVAKRRWPLLAIAGVVVLCLCGALAGGGYWWYTSTSAVVIQGGPQAQAQALYNEGHGLYQTGKYEAALDKLQAALELYRETGNRQGEGRTLNDIGGVYKCLGQYQEALECLEEALAISREIGDRQCEVSALNNIGEAYESSSQYSEALKHLEEALAISREVGDRQGEGQTLANIGWVYTDLGQYQDALKYSEEALAISRETGDRRVEGRAFNTIGTVYFHLKQYQEALGYFEKALAARREAGDRRGEASTLGNIGLMYDDLGQDQKALKYQEEALATKREIGDRQGEALTLSNIGLLYDFHGDHQKGLDYYKEALAVAREIGDRQVESNALSNIGSLHLRLGQNQEALKYYEEALAIRREIGDREGLGSSLGQVGGIYYYMGQTEKALECYKEALAAYEEIRGALTVEELKTTYTETYKVCYERVVLVLAELERSQEAFYYSERARARTLLDQMSNVRIDPQQSAAPELIEQEGTLRQEIGELDSALREEWAKAEKWRSRKKLEELSAQLQEKRAEYAKLLEKLKLSDPEYASLVTVEPLALEQIQKLLPEDTTLVEYFVSGKWSFAFIVSKDDFHLENLGVKRKDLDQMMYSFYNAPDLEGTHSELKTLYDALFAPIMLYIKTGSLIIVPHEVLHYLPFQALYDGNHYLIEYYTISYTPSGSVLPFALEKRKEKSDPALVLGNPAVPGAPPLEYSEREAQEVAELYGTKTHNGKEATETLFRSEASQAGLIHLACHGEYNPVNPLFSRLLLAPDGQNDGSLNVYELYDIELPQVDLVTLSACQTNLGQLSGGDEVIGLSRALIYAGAPTIVASLWAVEDEATAELMVSFYRHLKEGLSKAEALRAAQVEMLSQEKRAHPYYWAAFGLTGDPGKVSGYTHAPPHTTPPAYIERRKAQADALYGEGEELYKAGEYKVAQEKFQAAVEIYRDIESVQFYWKLEQYQERLGHYEKTLPTFRESGDRYGEGQTLNVIGITNEILGRNEEALKYYQEAEAIFHELGGRKEEAFVLNNIGVINRSLSQYQESLRYYQEALAIERELGDRAREEYILFNIGSFYQGQGQAQEALEYYQEALAIERELGDRAREGNTLYNLGVVYRNSERYQEALKYFAEALAIYRELSDRAGEGYTLVSMGVAYEGMGQDQEALKYYEDALAILHEIGDYYAEQGTIDIIERFHEKTQAK